MHDDGHDAVKFGIKVDNVHHFCVVSKKTLDDLSAPGRHNTDLLRQFEENRELVYEKTAAAIRGGLKGEPMHLNANVFTS